MNTKSRLLMSRITPLCILLLILTACGAPAPAVTERVVQETVVVTAEPMATPAPKILTVRLSRDMKNLDPAFFATIADSAVMAGVFDGLVAYKPGTWDIENVLAESLKQSDDGLRIAFKLKEGVQFQRGYGEVTAEDVKFSYERFLDPALNAPNKGMWEKLDHVEVSGKYTGEIVLKEAFAPIWTTMALEGGMILSKKAVEDIGNDVHATHPVGSGPYEFVEWMPNQKIVLTRFADYWGNKPEWDEIVLLPIVDDSAAEIALETGAVDAGFVSENSVDRFKQNDNFKVLEAVTMNYHGLLMNVQHPLLKDINVRQAIRYAIDVPSIIEAAYNGKAARANSFLTPGMLGYWDGAPEYARDVTKAKEYLKAAGVNQLNLTLTVLNEEVSRAVAEVVQANLAEIGINVEIISQEGGIYWDAGMGQEGLKNRQLTYIAWSTNNPDPYQISMWFTCDQVLQWNWMYWCDEEFSALHTAAISEVDLAKRAEVYVQMQKIWDKAVNVVWVAHPMKFLAVRTGLVPVMSPIGDIKPAAFHSEP